MPRILRNLRIKEVSSVDRGAGEGVKVLLMKRDDNAGNDTMTVEELAKKLEATTADIAKLSTSVADLTKAKDDATKKADALAEENAKLKRDIALSKMSAAHKEYMDAACDTEAKRKAFTDMTDEERDAEMKRSPKTKRLGGDDKTDPEVRKLADENTDLKKRLAVIEERETVASFAKRAVDMGLKAEDGDMIRKAYGGDAEAQKKLDTKIAEMTKAVKAAQEAGGIFAEFGKTDTGAGATAHDQMVAKGRELRKADDALTEAQAYTKALTDPANAELAKRVRQEEVQKRQKIAA